MAAVHTVSGMVDGEATDNKGPNSSGFRRCLHLPFIKTPLGILQIVATVVNVICIGIMGDVITSSIPQQNYWLMAGFSYMTFFVMLSFMGLMMTLLIFFTSLTSYGTATLLPKTTFFLAYHVLMTLLYLCTSTAVLSEAAKISEIYAIRFGNRPGSVEPLPVRGQVLAGGSFGVFATVVYGALTVLSVYHYTRA